ncbi:hypothetical protein PAE0776 [Pyrobaculum aerophilum str. IM2]|uniref:Uncharacterized protein n=2 Tax=Pyrobaculum aerophilum TaxID=13773 RepID=Q8ZYH3_PYRAE|nr:hypothetical protein [Pyrobaculum aerophilum]AAL63020.1 hypothetical protein PAE0776 [Pyrobaculum aerophilum str. IM2]HII48209.1 hypothetical protein [Pyrobaculum aerophilum]
MIDVLIALVIAFFSALGGALIKDIKALAVFTVLIALATFLVVFVTNMPTASLGLVGLAIAAVRIGRVGKRAVETRIKTYRARRRLSSLEEAVRAIPENIIDVVPAGSTRAIHPKLVNLVTIVNNAYAKGYAVEEPNWLRAIRQYLATLGPHFSADKTKILSEYELLDLEP